MNQIDLETIDSTHLFAKKHLTEFPQNLITCITAEEQTAGKGRYDRKWHSPKGSGLYTTFCLVLPHRTQGIESLSQILSFSFAQVLQKKGLSPMFKWPNDILLDNRKVAGVLTEALFEKEHIWLLS